jgi:putative peptidoglycan lipid II flippase
MLFRGLVAGDVYQANAGWPSLFARVLASAAAMTGFLLWVLDAAGSFLLLGKLLQVGWLVLAVGGGAVVYFGSCLLLGLRPSQFRMQSPDGPL